MSGRGAQNRTDVRGSTGPCYAGDYPSSAAEDFAALEARERRRATMTPHARLVEDLIDGFTDALRDDVVLNYFERLAARIINAESQ